MPLLSFFGLALRVRPFTVEESDLICLWFEVDLECWAYLGLATLVEEGLSLRAALAFGFRTCLAFVFWTCFAVEVLDFVFPRVDVTFTVSFANAAFAWQFLGFTFARVSVTVDVSFAVAVVEAGAAATVEVIAIFATEPVITSMGLSKDCVVRSLMGPGRIIDKGEWLVESATGLNRAEVRRMIRPRDENRVDFFTGDFFEGEDQVIAERFRMGPELSE